MKVKGVALLLVLAATPLLAAPRKHAAHHPQKVQMMVPRPRPHIEPAQDVPRPASEAPIDLSHALQAGALKSLPSSAEQLGRLSSQLAKGKPQLATAKQKSDSLATEAAALRQQLIDTAARIESLEREEISDADAITKLEGQDGDLTASLARDRIPVTHLLAVLERLQHDMPPALAMRPDDALGAARGAMLVGASLPPIYARAAALSRRIDALRRTRIALGARRQQAAATRDHLAGARLELDRLVARKQQDADAAANAYGTLKADLAAIAAQAADFQTLLTRIAHLRAAAPAAADQSIVTVAAQKEGGFGGAASLLPPVVGTFVPPDGAGDAAGVSYATRASAQVIAPADGKVLYAGPYHKNGQVLILEISTGYDLVLAGLGRVTVRPNDELLAGEPVGNMPSDGSGSGDNRLYFELRHQGHSLNPAPWLTLELRKAKKT